MISDCEDQMPELDARLVFMLSLEGGWATAWFALKFSFTMEMHTKIL